MAFEDLKRSGLVLLGCGKMGSALLAGWLEQGADPAGITAIEPYPSAWLKNTGVTLADRPPEAADMVLLAVKPQMMAEALGQVAGLEGALFLSIAAGLPLAFFEAALGPEAAIVRAMPNTPAAVGQGVTALIGNAHVTPDAKETATALMRAVGSVLWLENEAQMDAVTAVSGSGPAYVFHMIEALTEAGIAEGLSESLATELATATVAGAGALAMAADESAETLRVNVTSPKGTTEAGLSVLMAENGLRPLVRATVAAAAKRSRELGA